MSGIFAAIQGLVGLGSLFISFFVGLGAAFSFINLVTLLMKPNPLGYLNEQIQEAAVLTGFLLVIAYMGVKFAGMMVADEASN